MLDLYRRLPIARQIIIVAASLLVIIFTAMTVMATSMASRSAVALAESDLKEQMSILQDTLDSVFDSVLARGERQMNFFRRQLPGDFNLGSGMVRTGNVDLPVIRAGGEVLNGNRKMLLAFQELTGEDAAVLAVHEGKLYRAATLLKKDGVYQDGTEIKAGDPVADAILQGKDYGGLAIRNGTYYFSTVKALKTAEGKVYGGISVRIKLDSELRDVRALFGKVKVADTGYVYIAR